MIAHLMLAAAYQDNILLIAALGLALFALFTGLFWSAVIALRSIAISLRELADKSGQ